MLLKGYSMYIPKSSTNKNLIKEKDSGGLAKYFGNDKTYSLVNENYFWPQMYEDVRKCVQEKRNCQVAMGSSQNTRSYQPMTIPKTLIGYQH